MFDIIFHFLSWVLFIYLGLSVLYLFFFAVMGRFGRQASYQSYPEKYSIAVLIFAYREDAIICDTVENALKQSYPDSKYEVIVVADSLKPTTLDNLARLPVQVRQVGFEKSTKFRAMKSVMSVLPRDKYDIILVLDADNVMGTDNLEKINHAFHSGCSALQLHRTAKNRNTPVAILEAVSEEINNHIFRKGHRAVGMSSALIGSGMAFRFSYFRDTVLKKDQDDVPGEADRGIELNLLRDRIRVEYLDDGLLLDEKVQDSRTLEKQRTRWMGAQREYLLRLLSYENLKLLKFKLDYWDKVLQCAILPRALLLVFLTMTSLIAGCCYYLHAKFLPGNLVWVGMELFYMIILTISFPFAMLDWKFFKAILWLPHSIFALIKALLKSKTGKQEFIHTPKDYSPNSPNTK